MNLKNIGRNIKIYLFSKGQSNAILLIGLSKIYHNKNSFFLKNHFKKKLINDYGIYCNPNVDIGENLSMPHPTSIVIGEGVSLGDNVTIYQNVTIGGARKGDWSNGNYPSIGNNVTIFSGAVIIGNIHIGDNVIIGANSVVNKSIPSEKTVAGVPAKIIR
ncbi:hypothetical protein BCS95_15090 [Vibrio breoganii]|uniref:serine O-acetyltransferase n=1 Tax=Vibrio breoganii TaxID=553239 RepID=UPI000C81F19E|nr:hypothetical protein [Vibrio breoganii]PMP00970.1 hypothetical protein BCS95_15090 [Vibrio breoganii]